jgi:integrase
MYSKHGAFWYVDRANKWHPLGKEYSAALKGYAALIDPAATLARIDLLIGRYENEILPKRAAETAAGRKQQFKRIRKVFGHMNPKDLQGTDAWQYMQDNGGTQQARHEIAALSAVMGWAVKWGAIERNPLLDLKFEGFKPRDRYVTDAEFVAVRSIAIPMIRYAMNIALITAARQASILGLERRHIADGVLTITESKTGKRHTFPVAGDLKANIDDALAACPQLRPHVIVNRKGKRYTRDGFQSIWQRVMLKALDLGLIADRFTFHDIRAKNLSEAKSLEEARQRAQHSDAKVTQRVYRRLPESATVADIGHLLDKG